MKCSNTTHYSHYRLDRGQDGHAGSVTYTLTLFRRARDCRGPPAACSRREYDFIHREGGRAPTWTGCCRRADPGRSGQAPAVVDVADHRDEGTASRDVGGHAVAASSSRRCCHTITIVIRLRMHSSKSVDAPLFHQQWCRDDQHRELAMSPDIASCWRGHGPQVSFRNPRTTIAGHPGRGAPSRRASRGEHRFYGAIDPLRKPGWRRGMTSRCHPGPLSGSLAMGKRAFDGHDPGSTPGDRMGVGALPPLLAADLLFDGPVSHTDPRSTTWTWLLPHMHPALTEALSPSRTAQHIGLVIMDCARRRLLVARSGSTTAVSAAHGAGGQVLNVRAKHIFHFQRGGRTFERAARDCWRRTGFPHRARPPPTSSGFSISASCIGMAPREAPERPSS